MYRLGCRVGLTRIRLISPLAHNYDLNQRLRYIGATSLRRMLSDQIDKDISKKIPNETNAVTPPPITNDDKANVIKNKTSETLNITSAAKIGIKELNRTYADIERSIMEKIKEKNYTRFRIFFVLFTIFTVWFLSIGGKQLSKWLSRETAGIAKETLQNEDIKIHTQELATAVVQTILNDKDIASNAAAFLKEAASVPETQLALLKLTLHVLQHEESLKELTVLTKKLLAILVKDPDTVKQFSELLVASLQQPVMYNALIAIFGELSKDPEIMNLLTDFLVKLLKEPQITDATRDLLMESANTVLQDHEILQKSKEFVAEVVGDDMIQRESGDALLNTALHALKPGSIRIVGATIVVLSIGLARIILSPF